MPKNELRYTIWVEYENLPNEVSALQTNSLSHATSEMVGWKRDAKPEFVLDVYLYDNVKDEEIAGFSPHRDEIHDEWQRSDSYISSLMS